MNFLVSLLNRLWAFAFVLGIFFIFSFICQPEASAGVLEFSGSFSFNQSSYGPLNTQWTRRWGASAGYYFFARSEIEFSFQDVLYRTRIDMVEDTTFHDQIYSVDWVQSFTSRESGFQPYLKVGIGELNRSASGVYSDGLSPDSTYNSLTAVAGMGLRIFVLHSFAVRVDGTTYLTNGLLSTWQNNFSFNAGFSIYL